MRVTKQVNKMFENFATLSYTPIFSSPFHRLLHSTDLIDRELRSGAFSVRLPSANTHQSQIMNYEPFSVAVHAVLEGITGAIFAKS